MKILRLNVLLLVLLLALPTTAFRATEVAATDFKVLIADRTAKPLGIDPAWVSDTASAELLENIYEPLLTFNRTDVTTFVPRLATNWTFQVIDEFSPEGLRWVCRLVFTLRTGVYFQSDGINDMPGEGALLTPQDVEYTFERFLVTESQMGQSWMLFEPLVEESWMGGLSSRLTDLGWPENETTGWNTKCDEAIDNAIESNSTCVWFNLVMPYEPFLQILSQSCGSILNQAWCVWHGDWPGPSAGDDWYLWHDPVTSPLYSSDPSSPGPHLDCALGTGPYMLDYWNKGAGGSWSIIKNSNYWEGWTVPFRHEGWGPSEPAIGGHMDRYTSNYIPEWSTRKFRFLGGVSDLCDVPIGYKDQVLGQPGIQCTYPLPQLTCDAFFFNFLVSSTSTHLGVVQSNSTFSEYGAPPNIMNDTDFRLALAHMFDYTTFLNSSSQDNSTSPVTPIIPGIAYHDSSIGQKEDPATNQKKKYGISTEPTDTLAYNMSLVVDYLKKSWGGALWASGFTMDAVYSEGNLYRQIAVTLMNNSFTWINANYGTKFNLRVTSLSWRDYKVEKNYRLMPFFIWGWSADFPDAHNFALYFMYSQLPCAKYQGYLGVTSFPNTVVDSYVDAGVNTIVSTERRWNYSWLQQYYVDSAPGFVISQGVGRHFERDWVQGWYYNPSYPGNYIYDLWKAVYVATQDVDVEITNFACPTKIEVGLPVPANPTILPFPSPISVTVNRKDTNGAVPNIQVVIGVALKDASNREVVLGVDFATLNTGASYTADFYSFTQDSSAPINPGVYNCIARVLVQSGIAQDTDFSNNEVVQAAPVTVSTLLADVNVDGTIDMADISIIIDWFMTTPPNWNPACDVNNDLTIDMADISIAVDNFMQ